MVGDIEVVIGVVVLEHTAGGTREGESIPVISNIIDSAKKTTGQDLQLIDPIRCHKVGERGRGWRWWRGGAASTATTAAAASPSAVVMVVVTSALPHRHDVLEADVRLRGVVDAVGDRHHGDRVDGAAAGPVTAAHQRT